MLPTKINSVNQPLYLSRTKFKSRSRNFGNEDELEALLRENNFAIAYPERLSLSEQIYLVNKHEIIVGIRGSALHSVLFDLTNQKSLVCLADKGKIQLNYLLIDAVKNTKSFYISCLERKQKNQQTQVLNVDDAISGLKEIGLV
jgi:capsular polysaccharide biosynthesis protein